MSAYKDALQLSSTEQGQRLQLAVEVLSGNLGVVVLDSYLALRPNGKETLCEVIASGSATPTAQVQNAKQLLQSSTLGGRIQLHNCRWLVVSDYGSGTTEVWRES